ncbi:MAG: TIGR00730 family Rossman fold protein [Bacteroidetes bacterium]|nr:TIGR00730 family Rossman fold protein [Bacteroidota bacterium]MBU1580719.1 TIGR00730 family Rossman fold protein [Bacteroidota bacterium]MBU2466228.1 TIGR00730 family Rossman fold protein [Bacteroidota bacterium]MBU2557181.1 TIGR00730 family Rossman fold protein [Bacteroidota bacterium]
MRSICVFCGSSMGYHRAYREVAEELGKLLAGQQFNLIYGGASVGLMKVLADTMMANGGHVTGIMPQHLIDKEVAHGGIQNMIIVNSMAERKTRMLEMADAFVALPGGFGTLDEISEVLTLVQLRLFEKPLGLLNTKGYFDHLLSFLDHGVSEGFIREEHRSSIVVSFEAKALLKKLNSFQPVEMDKWISDLKTESHAG